TTIASTWPRCPACCSSRPASSLPPSAEASSAFFLFLFSFVFIAVLLNFFFSQPARLHGRQRDVAHVERLHGTGRRRTSTRALLLHFCKRVRSIDLLLLSSFQEELYALERESNYTPLYKKYFY